MGRTRNAVYWRRYRGFESLLLRNAPLEPAADRRPFFMPSLRTKLA